MTNEKVISKETIREMNPVELKDIMQCLVEWVSLSIDEQTEDQESFLDFMDEGIDTYDIHVSNLQYDLDCMANILSGFVGKYNLDNEFKSHLEELKGLQKDTKDYHGIAKEMYGDIDELFKNYPNIVVEVE